MSPYRQFHTLPGLLDSRATLSNSYPNELRAMQGGSSYHFYDGLWYDLAGRRTHDLTCERRTREPLSQPDMVLVLLLQCCQNILFLKYYTLFWQSLKIVNFILFFQSNTLKILYYRMKWSKRIKSTLFIIFFLKYVRECGIEDHNYDEETAVDLHYLNRARWLVALAWHR